MVCSHVLRGGDPLGRPAPLPGETFDLTKYCEGYCPLTEIVVLFKGLSRVKLTDRSKPTIHIYKARARARARSLPPPPPPPRPLYYYCCDYYYDDDDNNYYC